MKDKQVRPDKKVTYKYTRVCGACAHKEPYVSDDQKCEECGSTIPFKVER
jgi:rRNA maturation endonuclease Nob1